MMLPPQIDYGHPDIGTDSGIQQFCEKPQCPERNQIQMPCSLLPVGDTGVIDGPVEEQPEHQGAVGHKQGDVQIAVFHPIPPFPADYTSGKLRKQGKEPVPKGTGSYIQS